MDRHGGRRRRFSILQHGELPLLLVGAKRLVVRLAQQRAWTPVDEPVDVVNINLATYGVGSTWYSRKFMQSERNRSSGGPPIRYSSQVWLSPDASVMVVAFRVDAE